MRFVLASGSPRRRELLERLGLSFDIDAADLDESVLPNEAPRAYVERLAREKALAVQKKRPGAVVLAADTSVVLGPTILGKPGTDAQVGADMLRQLSGQTHHVMTGVAVAAAGVTAIVNISDVRFRALSEAEIAWYVGTGEGHDKAGGYAMQGRGGAFIEAISGSPTSVIGLPVPEALALLTQAGVRMPWA